MNSIWKQNDSFQVVNCEHSCLSTELIFRIFQFVVHHECLGVFWLRSPSTVLKPYPIDTTINFDSTLHGTDDIRRISFLSSLVDRLCFARVSWLPQIITVFIYHHHTRLCGERRCFLGSLFRSHLLFVIPGIRLEHTEYIRYVERSGTTFL